MPIRPSVTTFERAGSWAEADFTSCDSVASPQNRPVLGRLSTPEKPPPKPPYEMFQKGQKVVCIDDSFPREVQLVYRQLPKKDSVYTVRAVYIGRGKMLNAGHMKGLNNKPGDSDGEIGILLEELKNPADAFNVHRQELGFNAERFRTMETVSEDETLEVPAELAAH
jgi:hypothetical protein